MNKSTADWEVRSLASLGTYLNGFAFKPQHWGDHGLPIVRIRELLDQTVEPDRYDGPLAQAFKIQDGDLIFSWSATLAALFWNRGPAYLNQHLFKVTASNDVDRRFLHQLINFNLDSLAARSHGTTMKHVTRGDLADYIVRLPALSEQRRIAEVVDTLDDQIRATEQVIAKLKLTEQGLLDDVFRNPLDSWTSIRLGEISTKITDGTHQAVTTEDETADSVPFLYVSSVRNGRITWESAGRISERTYTDISKGRVPEPGMVLYTAVGSYGHAAVVRLEQRFGFQRHIACIYPNRTKVLGEFIAAFLNSSSGRLQSDRMAVGNAQKTVTLSALSNFELKIPKLPEQERIVDLFSTTESQIFENQRSLSKIQLIKRGLMSDLLTGRVRVLPERSS